MKTTRAAAADRDLHGALRALERAAAAALRLAQQTNTPCYVLKNGRIVDLNASRVKTRAPRTR
jgi:hypothetical protein